MLRRVVPLALALLLAPALPSSSALAVNSADFTLKNQTRYQINEVCVSAYSSKNWGKDVMGENTLDAGNSMKVTSFRNNRARMFDIMVKYHDDTKAKWASVDLHKYSAIPLYRDKKNRNTRAVGE